MGKRSGDVGNKAKLFEQSLMHAACVLGILFSRSVAQFTMEFSRSLPYQDRAWVPGGGGGGVLGLMFAGYVPLASQSPYPILVYFLANYRPHLSHFLENVIFAIPT